MVRGSCWGAALQTLQKNNDREGSWESGEAAEGGMGKEGGRALGQGGGSGEEGGVWRETSHKSIRGAFGVVTLKTSLQ